MEHGVSGLLIASQEQAWDALMALRDSPALCRQIGLSARQKALDVHGAEATERDLAFYLR
jgi:hypothetical protein